MHECDSDVLIARINKGEKVIKSILNFCKNSNIDGAWISGLGAFSEARLALYDLENKKYIKKNIKGPLEICSLVGNIGIKDKEHVVHIHVVLSDNKMAAFGGHLEEATVAATCELKVEIFDHPIIRKHDSEIGLNLIEIG
jgi:hypothetical protein